MRATPFFDDELVSSTTRSCHNVGGTERPIRIGVGLLAIIVGLFAGLSTASVGAALAAGIINEVQSMNRTVFADVMLVSALLVTISCVPPPRMTESEEAAGRPSEESTANALFAPPSPETIPGDLRGEQIRLGYKMIVDTQEYGKRYVGNALNCINCHLDAGLNPNSASFVGISTLYPQYRERAGRQMTLADRINECFERSMNGKPLPPDSVKLTAIVAYIEWLSQNMPPGSAVPWRGIPRLTSTHPPDPLSGKKVYEKKCVFCHGSEEQGTLAAPPLWGSRSYNIGAGMARISVAASFIKANMPRGWGWTVTDDEAVDVAAYINTQPRPDFPDKIHDWPKGNKPADVPY